MNSIKKFLLTAITFASLVLSPAANAFAPLVILASIAEGIFTTAPGVAATAGFGSALVAIKFMDSPTAPSNSPLSSKPLTVHIDPNTPLATPPGWTNPNTPPSSQTPQETTQYFYAGVAYSSAAASCNAFWAHQGPLMVENGYPNAQLTRVTETSCFYTTGSGSELSRTTGRTTSTNCPPGYNPSGTNCVLANPEQVKKPPKGLDEISREGNEFKRDPQQDISDNNPNVVLDSPNRISYTDPATGEKVTINLNPSTGAATVTHSVPNRGNGTTTVQTSSIGSPASGSTFNGQSTSTYSGIGDQVGTTPISSGTGQNDGNCAHCATEVTLSNLRDITNDIKTTLNGNNPMPEQAGIGIGDRLDGVQDGALSALGSNMRDMVTNSGLLQAYQNNVLPISPWAMATDGQNASCELSFTLMGKPYDISICQAQPFLHSAIAFGLFILTALGIFHLVTERPEGS